MDLVINNAGQNTFSPKTLAEHRKGGDNIETINCIISSGSQMWEKRKVERFDLHIETQWNVLDTEIVENPKLITRNISSSGAFLITTNPVPVGTNIELNFFLKQQELSNGTKNRKVAIRTIGKVIRTDEEGMAVEFEKLHKVSQVKHQFNGSA